MKIVKIGPPIINITHPEKILFPYDGITNRGRLEKALKQATS